MEFINTLGQSIYGLKNKNKFTFFKERRRREKEARIKQGLERIHNLKIMLAKGLITQEEYDSKVL